MKRDERANCHPERRKQTQSLKQTLDRKRNLPSRMSSFTNFTPLIIPIEQVLMQIKDESSLQWPQPMLAPTEGRDMSRYYRFHQDHGHRTDECIHLKWQLETLIRQGRLRKFV